jgi:hypothetical protein
MRKYPIGLQSFDKLRSGGYLYVDKTAYIKELVDTGCHYFLSRPRRFGKSLFVDTMHCAFDGKRHLFGGLYLDDNWDWSRKNPVLKVSFGSGVHRSLDELRETMEEQLNEWMRRYDVNLSAPSIKGRFKEIIEVLFNRTGEPVAVLIDEYDKPILDNITNPDLALELRDELKNFYSVLKDADQYLKLVFITGVSKFSKVSLFSGLNNLRDISVEPEYSAICGYTQQELESNFEEELSRTDAAKVREWYNGYSWGNGTVYNPFDILQFFMSGSFRNYWFESGTPSFLLKLMAENGYPLTELEDVEAGEKITGSFDLDNLDIKTLLFQSGYLTIKRVDELLDDARTYVLSYPNKEVRMSLTDYLLEYVSGGLSNKENNRIGLAKLIKNDDVAGMEKLFQSFFASIPHDWFRKNNIAEYEGFYSSVFYAYFAALGLDVKVEDTTNRGRLDMAVIYNGICYIFEFKVVEDAEGDGSALQQIIERKYAEKYAAAMDKIYLIGVEFCKTDRSIARFEVQNNA